MTKIDTIEARNLTTRMRIMASEIRAGITKNGIVHHSLFGPIFAYEVDGYGSQNLMDDANLPSLLSAATMGYVSPNDEVYLNTRLFALSEANPYWMHGDTLGAIGGPHLGPMKGWPLASIVRVMTSTDNSGEEAREELGAILNTTDGLGGGSGFGAGIAKTFAEHGAKVVVADINEAGGNSTVESSPERMKFHRTDVTKQADWKSLVEATETAFGRVDCLVNNAGTTYRNKPTLEVTEAEFDRCFNVNVKSVYFGVQAVVLRLLEQKTGGSIINIASIGATRPRPGLVWYNSSKGAVWNATKGLAAEYGPHQIRVNAICPLLSGTGLFESFAGMPDTPANRTKFLANVPMGRLCEVKDVADTCLWLASGESGFVTGVCVEVDGGRGV
ncbi:MAG: hypothetical protein Q9220_001729 [cf. Caloplaca sp. 1 TL-2023]